MEDQADYGTKHKKELLQTTVNKDIFEAFSKKARDEHRTVAGLLRKIIYQDLGKSEGAD